MVAEPVMGGPETRIKGLTRQDEQDMAEQGKRQRFNVRQQSQCAKTDTDLNSETSASCPCLALPPP